MGEPPRRLFPPGARSTKTSFLLKPPDLERNAPTDAQWRSLDSKSSLPCILLGIIFCSLEEASNFKGMGR
jgi:hypothetical protein